MKTIILLLVAVLSFYSIAFSQATIASNIWNANRYLGFNASNGVNPLFFRTNAINRMKLNGNVNYAVNGFMGPRNGYMLLGNSNNSMAGGANIYTGKGAFSLLHLNGPGTVYQEFGHRPWMQTGITFTGNRDLSYFGLRKLSDIPAQEDITETVLLWSDNAGTSDGPDHLVFRFSGFGGNDNSVISTNLASTTDLDGLHVATFTGGGFFGLGNTFGTNASGTPAGLYVNPASLAHYSLSNNRSVWQQFTNRNQVTGSGTGELATDGLRLGIVGNGNLDRNGIGLIYNQENRPLLLSANANTNNVNGSITNERVRIMAYNTPTALTGGGYGVYNPGALDPNTNVTRMSISHNPAQPVTRPLSLLHLGYNSGNAVNPNATDGWRPWMDVGMFIAQGSDNVFIGLKPEQGSNTLFPDRYDAVINWGDNQAPDMTNGAGPDNLRFIFTSTTTANSGQGDPVSQSENGLETMRISPELASTLQDNFGMVGIGNFAPNSLQGPGSPNYIDAKLDIDGDLRIRTVEQNDSLIQVLVIDPDDLNRVYYREINSLNPGGGGATTANNGATINPANNVQWGQVNSGTGASNGGQLVQNTEIPTNGFNVSFPGLGAVGQDRFQIGAENPAGTSSKMYLENDAENNGFVIIHNGANQPNLMTGQDPAGLFVSTAGFNQPNPSINAQVYAIHGVSDNPNSMFSTGVFGEAESSIRQRVGVQGQAMAPPVGPFCQNIGGRFTAENANGNIGVFAQTLGTSANDFAAFFVGQSFTTAGAWAPSDSTLKQNINNEQNTLTMLSKLRPVNYEMRQDENPHLGLAGNLQHGFISQEVQQLYPELVQTIVHPAQYDSLGVEISPETEILGLNYNGFISLNTKGIIDLNRKYENSTLSDESLKNNVIDLENNLQKILDLRGVTYQWNAGAIDSLQLDNNTHIGFIAQEVAAVDPLLTYWDDMDLLHVDYAKVVPVMVEAFQEMSDIIDEQADTIDNLNEQIAAQNTEINDLNQRLTTLENCLSGILPFLCHMSNTMIAPTQDEVQTRLRSYIDVELNNAKAIILDQNVPNPFAETTVITYSIPESVGRAQIHFFDASGNLIKSVEVNERGDGQLNVFGQDLSSGVYTYSLVADGNVVATKRMVKN